MPVYNGNPRSVLNSNLGYVDLHRTLKHPVRLYQKIQFLLHPSVSRARVARVVLPCRRSSPTSVWHSTWDRCSHFSIMSGFRWLFCGLLWGITWILSICQAFRYSTLNLVMLGRYLVGELSINLVRHWRRPCSQNLSHPLRPHHIVVTSLANLNLKKPNSSAGVNRNCFVSGIYNFRRLRISSGWFDPYTSIKAWHFRLSFLAKHRSKSSN